MDAFDKHAVALRLVTQQSQILLAPLPKPTNSKVLLMSILVNVYLLNIAIENKMCISVTFNRYRIFPRVLSWNLKAADVNQLELETQRGTD